MTLPSGKELEKVHDTQELIRHGEICEKCMMNYAKSIFPANPVLPFPNFSGKPCNRSSSY